MSLAGAARRSLILGFRSPTSGGNGGIRTRDLRIPFEEIPATPRAEEEAQSLCALLCRLSYVPLDNAPDGNLVPRVIQYGHQ